MSRTETLLALTTGLLAGIIVGWSQATTAWRNQMEQVAEQQQEAIWSGFR